MSDNRAFWEGFACACCLALIVGIMAALFMLPAPPH